MFSRAVFVVALLAATARANIQAFSGTACNGDVGLSVPCDGSCHSFETRHSFRVDANSGTHCVTMFIDAGCPSGAEGRMFTFTDEDGQCQDVNTGTHISSFLCSNTNTCEV